MVQEITWTVELSWELGIEFEKVSVYYMENKSAIELVNNSMFHKQSRHNDIKYHLQQEKIHKVTGAQMRYIEDKTIN